ncbi:MAG: glucose 1-dehydrogenase [Spirochaetaceae bacterium]|nr:MAG: glucose 1-dehydrogenase [Spirochaetaceae bacterium]
MSNALFSLEGKTALVTGSTQGIGRAIATGLAEAGATVILNGRDAAKLDGVVREFTDAGFTAHGVAFDVTGEEAVAAGVAKIAETIGDVHILVNNAGGTIRKFIQELTLDEWNHVMNLNLNSAFLVSRALVPQMLERKAGKIVNVCSLMSDIARQQNTPYAASKGAIRMFTRSLAVELGPSNIQVNGIGPGYFVTPLTRVLQENQQFDGWLKGRTPMARWGTVDELVGAAVFLASPASSFVTGQILYVDGGFTAAM